jgi:hypothetical protein
VARQGPFGRVRGGFVERRFHGWDLLHGGMRSQHMRIFSLRLAADAALAGLFMVSFLATIWR